MHIGSGGPGSERLADIQLVFEMGSAHLAARCRELSVHLVSESDFGEESLTVSAAIGPLTAHLWILPSGIAEVEVLVLENGRPVGLVRRVGPFPAPADASETLRAFEAMLEVLESLSSLAPEERRRRSHELDAEWL